MALPARADGRGDRRRLGDRAARPALRLGRGRARGRPPGRARLGAVPRRRRPEAAPCGCRSPQTEPAGLDVVADPAATRAWLAAELGDSTPVLGMYGYADGGAHVLLSGAFDAIAAGIGSRRPDAAIAFLATPTDSYVVPARAVAKARAAYRARRLRRVAQAPLKLASGGRLYRPAYENGAQAPVADALIEQQGPNYAIAKRLQRWQGLLAAADGRQVSFNVAPATLTRSVTKNRVLAAAYAGARHFGIEIFEPATTRILMAALLVHDLHRRPAEQPQGEVLFSDGAAHGGLWTAAYEPRSALGLAAVAGLPSSSRRHGAAANPVPRRAPPERTDDPPRAQRQHHRGDPPLRRRDRRGRPAVERVPSACATSRSSRSCTC